MHNRGHRNARQGRARNRFQLALTTVSASLARLIVASESSRPEEVVAAGVFPVPSGSKAAWASLSVPCSRLDWAGGKLHAGRLIEDQGHDRALVDLVVEPEVGPGQDQHEQTENRQPDQVERGAQPG